MDVNGGEPRRLSWFGGVTAVVGWKPDGKAVVVSSDYQQPFPALTGLWEVPLAGGPAKPLRCGPRPVHELSTTWSGRGDRTKHD